MGCGGEGQMGHSFQTFTFHSSAAVSLCPPDLRVSLILVSEENFAKSVVFLALRRKVDSGGREGTGGKNPWLGLLDIVALWSSLFSPGKWESKHSLGQFVLKLN